MSKAFLERKTWGPVVTSMLTWARSNPSAFTMSTVSLHTRSQLWVGRNGREGRKNSERLLFIHGKGGCPGWAVLRLHSLARLCSVDPSLVLPSLSFKHDPTVR
eukprot:1472954-Rhodomonas_salina.4